ncbi:hypothetical protein [Candidatus Cardinium sp. cBcalN2]|uniref:hypothetical protein n=1 Tax=Candidatus Cardinium sp. cBcalN2 TaxID=2699436 RepID=UPI001FB4FC9D|nr:hypothetical protein [Candidatus Cardinium sp. cBcalN2]
MQKRKQQEEIKKEIQEITKENKKDETELRKLQEKDKKIKQKIKEIIGKNKTEQAKLTKLEKIYKENEGKYNKLTEKHETNKTKLQELTEQDEATKKEIKRLTEKHYELTKEKKKIEDNINKLKKGNQADHAQMKKEENERKKAIETVEKRAGELENKQHEKAVKELKEGLEKLADPIANDMKNIYSNIDLKELVTSTSKTKKKQKEIKKMLEPLGSEIGKLARDKVVGTILPKLKNASIKDLMDDAQIACYKEELLTQCLENFDLNGYANYKPLPPKDSNKVGRHTFFTKAKNLIPTRWINWIKQNCINKDSKLKKLYTKLENNKELYAELNEASLQALIKGVQAILYSKLIEKHIIALIDVKSKREKNQQLGKQLMDELGTKDGLAAFMKQTKSGL